MKPDVLCLAMDEAKSKVSMHMTLPCVAAKTANRGTVSTVYFTMYIGKDGPA